MKNIYADLPKVIHVLDGRRAVINRGSAQGAKINDKFLVFRLGEELFDPDTNESLGFLEIVVGRAAVSHVQENMATITGTEMRKIPGTKRLIKKSPLYNSLASIISATTEEIEEGPEEVPAAFDVEVGDLVKPI